MAGQLDFSWLDLNGPDRSILKQPPVVLVLFAIKFLPVLKVDNRDFAALFQDAIRRDFPAFDQSVVPPFSIQLPGLTLDPSAALPPSWLFRDVSREWTVTLSREALGFETRRYAGYEDFCQRLMPVLAALVEHVVPTHGTRIGLRYLDEVRPLGRVGSAKSASKDPFSVDWSKLIRADLFGIESRPMFRGRVRQSLHQLGLRDKYGIGMNINHGVIPGGSLIDPPSAGSVEHNNQPFYALDIDAFQEFERGKEFAVNTQGIIDRMNILHDAISRVFRWSLNADYLATLEGAESGS